MHVIYALQYHDLPNSFTSKNTSSLRLSRDLNLYGEDLVSV